MFTRSSASWVGPSSAHPRRRRPLAPSPPPPLPSARSPPTATRTCNPLQQPASTPCNLPRIYSRHGGLTNTVETCSSLAGERRGPLSSHPNFLLSLSEYRISHSSVLRPPRIPDAGTSSWLRRRRLPSQWRTDSSLARDHACPAQRPMSAMCLHALPSSPSELSLIHI